MKPEDLRDLYREIGRALKHKFVNGEAWVISSHVENLAAIGLKPSQRVELKNGALDCEFWKFEIFSGTHKDFKAEGNKLTKSFEVTKKKFDKKKPFVSDKKFDENKPRNKKYYDSERKSERKDDKKARIRKDDKRVKSNKEHNDKYDSSKLKKGSQEYEMQKYSKLIKKLDL